MPAASPLRARDLTVTRGSITVLDAVDLVVSAGRRIGVVGPNGVGKSTLLQALAGLVPPERGRVERTPPAATVGYLPQEPSRSDETVRELLARRTGVAPATVEMDAATAALAAGGAPVPTSATRSRSTAGSPSAAPTSTHASDRCGPTSGSPTGCSTSRRSRCRAARRPGRRSPPCCSPASTSSCSTSRRTTSTSTGSTGSSDGSPRYRPRSSSSATTARSSPAPSPTCSSSTSSPTGRRCTRRLAGLPRRARGRPAGGVGALRGLRHQAPWPRRPGPARAGVGDAGALQGEALRRARQVHPPLQGQPDRAARRPGGPHGAGDRAPRGGRQAPRSVAAAPRGDVGRPHAATSSAASTGSRSGAAVSRSARSTSSSRPVSGSRSSAPTAPARRRCSTPLLGRGELSAGTRTLGPSVVVGEVEQARDRLSGPTTVLRAFQDATGMDAADVRTLLAKFGLVADHVTRPAATLSPGERTRASLALLMANGANVLVLDEPTNHLDLPAIEQLESALDGLRRDDHPRDPRPLAARPRPPHAVASSSTPGGSSATRRCRRPAASTAAAVLGPVDRVCRETRRQKCIQSSPLTRSRG